MAAFFSPSAAATLASASPSATLTADCCWPSDCRIRARFSWSACFCSASACRICGGGAISTISMRLIRMPHLSVTTSICCWTSVLMRSRSDSASSSVIVPITERKRGAGERVDRDVEVLDTLNSACLASTTWVKIVAFTVTTTLSFVITSWRSPGTGISRISTSWSVDTNGAITTSPGSCVRWYSPNRFTTPTWPCCTMLIAPQGDDHHEQHRRDRTETDPHAANAHGCSPCLRPTAPLLTRLNRTVRRRPRRRDRGSRRAIR